MAQVEFKVGGFGTGVDEVSLWSRESQNKKSMSIRENQLS